MTLADRLEQLAAAGRLVGFERPQPAAASPPAPAASATTAPAPVDTGDPFNFGPLPGAIVATSDRLSMIEGRRKAIDAGYTEDGLAQLERYMTAAGIRSHEEAMPAFERENPQPDPVATSGGSWAMLHGHPPGDAIDFGALMGLDDEGETFLRQAIPAALNDVRRGR